MAMLLFNHHLNEDQSQLDGIALDGSNASGYLVRQY